MHNTLAYFRLYHHNPYLTFKILMKNHNDFMCKKALQIMRKSYLSSPIAWIGQWIGEHDGNTIIKKMDRLIQPTCIKTIDYDRQTIHFIKNFK
ncbi:hypothetical protein BDF20DRAFT_511026 [Mycotypha africana]|uniref:uncharacterized protein n=1 Tax=Mycotypha africana TaxID=64632 RepID=UPI0023014DDA|nr:uncharacterized protein BDF20DRAFT_511026 [Mycotypha africana]KAI8979498.1 hypothetical protein BDF20DRAFT_511026 [Mycotypha africana]